MLYTFKEIVEISLKYKISLLQTHQEFSNEIADRIWTLLYDLNISKNVLFWMK